MEVKTGHSGVFYVTFVPDNKPKNLDQAFEALLGIKDLECRIAALKGIAMAVVSHEAVGKLRSDPEGRLLMKEHLLELEEQAKKIWSSFKK